MAQWATSGELVERVRGRIQDMRSGQAIDQGDVVNVVEAAVYKLSRLAPLVVVATMDGSDLNADGTIDLADLSTVATDPWVNGFSTIRNIEYPIGDNPPSYIDANEYRLWPDNQGPTAVQFLTPPSTGTANIRVIYTAPHRVDDASTTVPAGPQRLALELFGVCALAEVYAARAAHNVDSGIQGDAVDYAGQSERWHAVAERACSEGSALLGSGAGIAGGGGAGAGGAAPHAAAWADVDPSPNPYSGLVWRRGRVR